MDPHGFFSTDKQQGLCGKVAASETFPTMAWALADPLVVTSLPLNVMLDQRLEPSKVILFAADKMVNISSKQKATVAGRIPAPVGGVSQHL